MTPPARIVGCADPNLEEIRWSEHAFIRRLSDDQRRDFRQAGCAIAGCSGICALITLGMTGLMIVGKLIPALSTVGSLAVLLFFPISLICLGVVWAMGPLTKEMACSKFITRRPRLFDRDENTFYVEVEDSNTFDKLKLIVDDSGLLRATPGWIQMELIQHQIQIPVADLSIELKQLSAQAQGVVLTCEKPPAKWSVSVTAPYQNWNLLLGASTGKRAKWLYDQIAGRTGATERA